MKVAVYSCIIPTSYARLCKQHYVNPEVDYLVFVPSPKNGPEPWQDRIIIRDETMSSRRDMQQYKMLSDIHLPEYDYTVWIDGRIRLRVDPIMLVGLLESSGKSVAFGTHPWRNCSYDEGAVCAPFKRNNEHIINRQMERYRREGLPEHYGLAASTFFVRDNRSDEAKRFFDLWYLETMIGSHRNQISFGYAYWKSGVDILWWEIPWGHNEFWTWKKDES